MRHGYKKVRLNAGKDAVEMLMRTLTVNFLTHGKIETTENRARLLKTYVDKLAEKSKERTEANKNCLLKALGSNKQKIIDFLFNQVGPVIKDKKGGYIRIIKVGQRLSDGSLVCRLEWAYPIVSEFGKKTKKQEKTKEVKK